MTAVAETGIVIEDLQDDAHGKFGALDDPLVGAGMLGTAPHPVDHVFVFVLDASAAAERAVADDYAGGTELASSVHVCPEHPGILDNRLWRNRRE